MMRSMYSGVSGLRVHQTKMDVIGNNIANVNTIGYKSQRVNFNEVFSQTLQSGSSASDETGRGGVNPMQVGLGVNVSSIDVLMTQGAAQRTDNPFDLMINGDGFIVVGDDTGKYFTRAGALRQDDNGNLVIPNGMKVLGWTDTKIDENGKEVIVPGEVKPISLGDPKNKTSPPETTTKVELSGNLDKNNAPINTQIKMYDSLGNLYTTPIKLVYNEANADWSLVPGHWEPGADGTFTAPTPNEIELKDTKGNVFSVANPINGGKETKFKFDEAGKLKKEGDYATSLVIGFIDLNNSTSDKKLNATIGNKEAVNGVPAGVVLDFSSLTQYASKTTVDPKVKDGKAPGTIMGFDVGGDGKITAFYDNGGTKLLGQISLANFENPAGLEKVGDNLFKATANSGDYDNIGAAGNFQSGVLEMSNVDLSREFTDMITTQRGFQANSRIISVSDEMLQELVNLKR